MESGLSSGMSWPSLGSQQRLCANDEMSQDSIFVIDVAVDNYAFEDMDHNSRICDGSDDNESRSMAASNDPRMQTLPYEPSTQTPSNGSQTQTPPHDPSTLTPPHDPSTMTPPNDPSTLTPPIDQRTSTLPLDPRTLTPPYYSRTLTPPHDSETQTPDEPIFTPCSSSIGGSSSVVSRMGDNESTPKMPYSLVLPSPPPYALNPPEYTEHSLHPPKLVPGGQALPDLSLDPRTQALLDRRLAVIEKRQRNKKKLTAIIAIMVFLILSIVLTLTVLTSVFRY